MNPPTSSSDDTAYDVIIVGARPAGAATAMLLAGAGLRVLALDRSAFGADTLSTHAILRGGVLQLSRWGLLDELVAAGTPPVKHTEFVYRDGRVGVDIKPAHGVDALYAPRRTLLDPVLVDAARRAGADLHHGISVLDLLWHAGAVAGVRALDSSGRQIELRARLVIGADGIRSGVAERVGAAVTRHGAGAAAATYGYWTDLDIDGFVWIFRPDACSGLIPTNDGRVCVFAGGSTERISRGGTQLIEEIVAEGAPDIAERLRSAKAPRGTRTWLGHPGFMRRPFGRGWALVGDAGYFKDPIGAHGITDALRDAELLARAVIDGWSDDRSLLDALAGYESERDRISVRLFDVVDRIAGHRWDDTEIAGILLELNAAMADEIETITRLDATPVG
jgi:flavin-dependent dehydrogenase